MIKKEFLKSLPENKIIPGQIFDIIGKEDCADSITLKTSRGQVVNLGLRSAEKVLLYLRNKNGGNISKKMFAHWSEVFQKNLLL